MHNTDKNTAVVFPGQGSQFAGMADPWTQHPAGRRVLDEASETMGRDVVAGCHDEALLATTEFVQPALLACAVAAFRVSWRPRGSRSEARRDIRSASSPPSWPPTCSVWPMRWTWSSSGAVRCSARERNAPGP